MSRKERPPGRTIVTKTVDSVAVSGPQLRLTDIDAFVTEAKEYLGTDWHAAQVTTYDSIASWASMRSYTSSPDPKTTITATLTTEVTVV